MKDWYVFVLPRLPCEILMSENKRQFETGIVINENSQDTITRQLRFFCGSFNDSLLLSLSVKEF